MRRNPHAGRPQEKRSLEQSRLLVKIIAMDHDERHDCAEKNRLLRDKNLAIREHAERAFALFQDAGRDQRSYRRLWNEATAAQKVAKEAGIALAKHVEEHGC
jgi:hypothetical protein